jgi:DNA-binding response OmpR family regulator
MTASRILVVEDEFLIGLHLADILEDAGYEVVGPAATVAEALDIAGRTALDGAVLDGNLNGERCDPVADSLHVNGVPFLFVTGYTREALPARFREETPVLPKPVNGADLIRCVGRLLG